MSGRLLLVSRRLGLPVRGGDEPRRGAPSQPRLEAWVPGARWIREALKGRTIRRTRGAPSGKKAPKPRNEATMSLKISNGRRWAVVGSRRSGSAIIATVRLGPFAYDALVLGFVAGCSLPLGYCLLAWVPPSPPFSGKTNPTSPLESTKRCKNEPKTNPNEPKTKPTFEGIWPRPASRWKKITKLEERT